MNCSLGMKIKYDIYNVVGMDDVRTCDEWDEMIWDVKWWKDGVVACWPPRVYRQKTNIHLLLITFTGENTEVPLPMRWDK